MKMPKKSIHLNVRHEFEIPVVFLKGTPEEIEEALTLGATVQHTVRTHRADHEVQKVTSLHQEEVQRITSQYQERLAAVQAQLSKLDAEKEKLAAEGVERIRGACRAEREVCSKEAEETVARWKREHDALVARYEAAETRKRLLEESRASDIQDAVKKTEEMMNKVVAAKEQQLAKMEAAYARLQDGIARQGEEISKLAGTLGKRAANVKTKGNDYEEQFGERLRRAYGLCSGFSLKSTGLGAGHEMDFSMGIEGHVVLWELKSYSSLVPKAEVDKFLRDLKENPQASIGVFISQSTDIHGKNTAGPLLCEFDGGKMMVYIGKFEEFCGDEELRVFAMLLSLFRIWWSYHGQEDSGFDRIEIIRELEKAVEEVGKRRVEWKRHKSHLEEVMRWTTDVLDESEDRLDRVLKKARNVGEACVHGVVEIPEGVFRETGEQKERLWVQSIMRCCVVGGEMEVRELVELLKGQHKVSSDTIRGNVMAVVRDSAIFKRGVSKWIKGISKYVPPSQIKVT